MCVVGGGGGCGEVVAFLFSLFVLVKHSVAACLPIALFIICPAHIIFGPRNAGESLAGLNHRALCRKTSVIG